MLYKPRSCVFANCEHHDKLIAMRSHRAHQLLSDQRGATIVEYGLMLALILVIAFAGYRLLGKQTRQAGDKATIAFF
jgi:Flp pilus assembly pilin Flp